MATLLISEEERYKYIRTLLGIHSTTESQSIPRDIILLFEFLVWKLLICSSTSIILTFPWKIAVTIKYLPCLVTSSHLILCVKHLLSQFRDPQSTELVTSTKGQ